MRRSAARTRTLTADDLAAFDDLEAPRAGVPRLDGLQDRPVGPGAGAPAAARAARRLRPRGDGAGSAEFVHTVVECAKLAFADREAWYGDPAFATCRSTSCSPPTTRPSAGRWSDDGVERTAAGHSDGRAGCRELRESQSCGACSRATGEPTRGRHLPHRRRRPLRKHRLGDAERWLAAELARHPRPRLPARHPRADVLARARPAELAAPRQAAAHDARPRRSRCATTAAVLAFGTPGRRPAGSVAARRSSCATCSAG